MEDRASTDRRRRLLPAYSNIEEQKVTISLNERDLDQLSYGVDILTFDDRDEKVFEHSDNEGVDFLKGDLITWKVVEDGRYDGRRCLTSKVIEYIEETHVRNGTSGVVTIHHHPGSGGTTLGRRVLWEMRKKVPCLSVRDKIENIESFKEKISCIGYRTRLPILLLFDGTFETEIGFLQNERVIILHVVRFYGSMENKKNSDGHFYLKGIVDSQDSRSLLSIFQRFGMRCCTPLQKAIEGGKKPFMYEYALAAFSENFRGIRKYVKGHLRDEEGDESESCKSVIKFLALATHYGHTTLPSQMFAKTLNKSPSKDVKIQDLRYLRRQLIEIQVVQDPEHPRCLWSIRYPAVAREILKQSLTKNSSLAPVESLTLDLSGSSCGNLKALAVKFIETLSEGVPKSENLTAPILDILKSVFITRHYVNDVPDKKYSMLFFDVGCNEYREEILKKLVGCFPMHADFHAHLGRFYTDERHFEEAETALLEALRTRERELASRGYRNQDGDDVLSRIHHMLGDSYFRKIVSMRDSGEIHKIHQVALQSIDQFEKARYQLTVAANQTYAFLGEVKVRFRVVAIAKEKNLIHRRDIGLNLETFAATSFGICDRLLAQCDERADEADLIKSESAFLFRRIPVVYGDLSQLLEKLSETSDKLSFRLCHLACLRHKLAEPGHRFSAFSEKLTPQDIDSMLDLLVAVINSPSASAYKGGVSTEMLEWLKLIRRRPRTPSLKDVLVMVEKWDKCKEKHSLSTFYLYVIQVAMALSCKDEEMNEKFRKEAARLRKKLPLYGTGKLCRLQYKSREFLGIAESTTISCLINGEELKGDVVKKLRRCTGVVCEIEKNHGIIYLDGPLECPIQIFCVRHGDNLTQQHARERVKMSFYIEFNPRHGAEAFDVAEVRKCRRCRSDVEVRYYLNSAEDSNDHVHSNRCSECGEICDA